MPKFRFGDIVYVKVWLPIDYDLGQIVRWQNDKQMYVMIVFGDNIDPRSHWSWCYVKEEDIDFANKLFDLSGYKNLFDSNVRLYPRLYS